MNTFFNIRDISVYRFELIGWSILWIMMLHFRFNQINIFGFVAQYGFAGVDIFMLVSGFGLYFSLNQHKNILHFYKKRLLRIFPTYYLLGIIPSLSFYHDSLGEYLFSIFNYRVLDRKYILGVVYFFNNHVIYSVTFC